MGEVIIVTDLGHVKAYRVIKDPLRMESDRIELFKSVDAVEAHTKPSDKFSDAAGRFYLGGGTGGTAAGYGEPHNSERETEKRLIRLIVDNINEAVSGAGCKQWHLAVDKCIKSQVLENLAPAVKAKLGKTLAANLTKISKSEILSRFA